MSDENKKEKKSMPTGLGIDADLGKHKPEENIVKQSVGLGLSSGKLRLTLAIVFTLVVAIVVTFAYRYTHPVFDIKIAESGVLASNIDNLTEGDYTLNFSAIVRTLEVNDSVEINWYDQEGTTLCTETTEVFLGTRGNYGRTEVIHSTCDSQWSEGTSEIVVSVDGETLQTIEFKIKD